LTQLTAPFLSRLERFETVDSTQRVVREWLDGGVPEVAIAVADHQSQGRGRQDRSWLSPPGAGLLLSIGFRPLRLVPRHGWRLAATVSLAMLDAAEEAAGLKDDTLWLKWPNDIVAEAPDGRLVKVAGVLGEVAAEGALITSAVVGLGINADWAASDFPSEIATSVSSLRELAGGRPIDREQLLESFLARLEPRYEALRAGIFDAGGWSQHQRTTGRHVELDIGDQRLGGVSTGVDPETGSLMIRAGGANVSVDSGEVIRCRVISGIGTAFL
jgi:BirA family transcriptional regulator, biotin operon repressor / biotin---[acetyl-CoA-carboxylase] ligase